jgi:phage terminase small subunit
VPCRYCHGTDHLYQYSDGEMRRAKAKHDERRQLRLDNGKGDIGEFDEQGGGGYNVNAEPNEECPNCGGAGEARSVLKDSRKYSAEALTLFVAARQTKEGVNVDVKDRDAALLQVARHLGFFDADKDPVANITFNVAEADAMYERAMAKSAEDAAHAKGRMQRLRDRGVIVDSE